MVIILELSLSKDVSAVLDFRQLRIYLEVDAYEMKPSLMPSCCSAYNFVRNVMDSAQQV